MSEKRILIVDSDKQDCERIASFCREFNYRVASLNSSEGLIDALKADAPDLLVLNVELPSENGFIVFKKIKSSRKLKKIPLILTSDQKDKDPFKKHRTLKEPANGYFYKPVDQDDFIDLVEETIGLPEEDGLLDAAPSKEEVEDLRIALSKSEAELEEFRRKDAESYNQVSEKSQEVELLKESYENIKRKLEAANNEVKAKTEEAKRAVERNFKVEKEYQEKIEELKRQKQELVDQHDQDLQKKDIENEETGSQIEQLMAEINELNQQLQSETRKTDLLEQENQKREEGLKDRIKDLLAQTDDANREKDKIHQELEKLQDGFNEEIEAIVREKDEINEEKLKMEQRVIKAYKKIKMDQLRDEKVVKALDIALKLLNPDDE